MVVRLVVYDVALGDDAALASSGTARQTKDISYISQSISCCSRVTDKVAFMKTSLKKSMSADSSRMQGSCQGK